MRNIEKLIADHTKFFAEAEHADITASEIQQLHDIIMSRCNPKEQTLAKGGFCNNILFYSIVTSWEAAYMAGYNKAQADAKRKAKPIKGATE